MAMTDFLEAALLNHVLNNDAYAPSATLYVALFTAAPDDTGGGTEVSGGSYARVAMAAGWTLVDLTTRAENTADVLFTQATADWGILNSVAIMSASSGGDMLLHGSLTNNREVLSGDTFCFLATDLAVIFS